MSELTDFEWEHWKNSGGQGLTSLRRNYKSYGGYDHEKNGYVPFGCRRPRQNEHEARLWVIKKAMREAGQLCEDLETFFLETYGDKKI